MAQLSRYHRIHKFENGATLIYYKQNVNNTTKFLAGFLGGASQDKIPGTAHFLEHMLHTETPNMKKEVIAKVLRDYDVESNAFTGDQFLVFYADVPNRNLDAVLDLDSQLLFNTEFNKESIELERAAIDEEINICDSQENARSEILDSIIETIKIDNRSEEFSIAGTHEDIAKIDEKVLKEYADRVFVSENMVISVVSNLEFDEIKEKFEKYFVSKAKSDPTKKVKYEKTKYYPPSNYIVKDKNPNQKTVEVVVTFMSRKPEKDTRLYSYIEDYIFNGFAGKLLKEIRRKRGLAYSAHFIPQILLNNMSLNSIYTTTSKDKVNETIKTIGEIIKDVARNGISQEDLTTCQNMIITREEDRRNGLKTIDPFTILLRHLEGTEVFFNNQIHRVKELSLDNVNKYLTDTYSNANLFVTIKGDIPDNCYTPYQIQKLLNAKLSQVSYDMLSGDYQEFETNKKITEKKAFEIANGITKSEKLSNFAFVFDNSQEELKAEYKFMTLKELLKMFPIDQQVEATNDLLKSWGIEFSVVLKEEKKEDEVIDIDEYKEDTNDIDTEDEDLYYEDDYENQK